MFETEKDVRPAKAGATKLATAMLAMVTAEHELSLAKARVPSYTGQYTAADYFAPELEAWNRAADAYLDQVRIAVSPSKYH